MRVFIGYKYTHVKDKDKLINNLNLLADKVESIGHTTFMLGRDIKRWEHVYFASIKLLPVTIKNMFKSDKFLVLVPTNDFSKGLFIELILATLFGKKKIGIEYQDGKLNKLRPFFNKIVKCDDINQFDPNLLSA